MNGATYGRAGNSKSLNISMSSFKRFDWASAHAESSPLRDKQGTGSPKCKETESELSQNE